jgi:hypothetical protein
MSQMSFGEYLKQLRKRVKWDQKKLADRAVTSIAMISAMELDFELPGEDLAERLMKAFKLDKDKQKEEEFAQMLKEGPKNKKTREGGPNFGLTLQGIMDDLGITAQQLLAGLNERQTQLSEDTYSKSYISHFIKGTKLPGDVLVNRKLIPFLKAKGASEKHVHRLIVAHLTDNFARCLMIDYLKAHQQLELLEALLERARDRKFVSAHS